MPGQFDELRKKLEAQLTFPSIYMFKFILKSDNRKMALIESMFEEDADIIQNQSGKGNFTSITVKQIVMSVDEIIAIYERAAQIEGVMSL
ncbi:MAG: DUF493 family protein [Bacteroidetes bacterium]|nr:DUF493 family protein [Bacteroidota bacterium]